VIVDPADRLLSSWQARAEPVRPAHPEDQWSIFGVDIADYYVRSWMRAALDEEIWRRRVEASSIRTGD
jgi:hypothetical protein